MSELMKHKTSKDDQMQAHQGRWKPLIIADQPPKPGGPREAALYNPAARQENEPALGLWQLDHCQAYALLGSGAGRFVPGIALVHKRYLDVLSGRFLPSTGNSFVTFQMAGRSPPLRASFHARRCWHDKPCFCFFA